MVPHALSQFPALAARAAAAERRTKERSDAKAAKQLFLPGLEDWMRAMPNPLARSSLFAPIARGRKKFHHQTVLVSRIDATITFTGYQLDEPQADAWLQLMHVAKDAPLGQAVTINRAGFLRAIGHGTSGKDYAWLRCTMFAFTAATITIEARKPDGSRKYLIGNNAAFHMLIDFVYDADSETYTFTVDPRWAKLYDGREYALINWVKRMEIARGQDMAKALQRLVSTSSDEVQRYSLEWLKEKLQYGSPMRKFRTSLESAMRELERVKVISSSKIELSTKGKEQAVWTKVDDRKRRPAAPSSPPLAKLPSSRRHRVSVPRPSC
jgi:hypothetical protein